jgi:hypothetical protein
MAARGRVTIVYYPAQTRITALTAIRRERLLPARGQVLVRSGESVKPRDPVARCTLPGKLFVVELSQALGVRPDQAFRYMRKPIGSTVRAHDVLAERTMLFGRRQRCCRTAVDGRVLAIRAGRVLIASEGTTFELSAGISGQVTDVIPERGVVISTAGALIQGAWGSGGESEGVLRVLVAEPQGALEARSFDADCQRALLVGGQILGPEALERAAEVEVGGIIVGSMNTSQCRLAQSLPYPLVVTEGFGTFSMSRGVFTLLQSLAGHAAMLNAGRQTHLATPGLPRRPELVVPLKAEGVQLPQELDPQPLKVGMQVRGLRAPYLGMTGTVANLPTSPQMVESGIRLPVAEVRLEGGQTELIPLANLESIH